MLVLTLVLMGAATFLIGLLPTYNQVGVWAAVALVALRIVQGFGVGGEWGGAVLMALGGGLALSDRRYALAARKPREALARQRQQPIPAVAMTAKEV